MKQESLFEQVCKIHYSIDSDGVPVEPLEKCFLLAYLAKRLVIKQFVEIGVGHAEILLSVSAASEVKSNAHIALITNHCDNLPGQEAEQISYCRKLLCKQRTNAPTQDFSLVETSSAEIVSSLQRLVIDPSSKSNAASPIDMLKISGKVLTDLSEAETIHILSLVQQNGFLIFDNLNEQNVRHIYENLKQNRFMIYETASYGILLNRATDNLFRLDDKFCPCELSHYAVLKSVLPSVAENIQHRLDDVAKVFVAVTGYSHEKFLEKVLASLIPQHSDSIKLTVGIFADCTAGNMQKILDKMHSLVPQINWMWFPDLNKKHYPNIFQVFQESNCDYLSIINGDHVYSHPQRIAEHIEALMSHPECAVSVNDYRYFRDDFQNLESQTDSVTDKKLIHTAFDLAKEHFIEYDSCSMIRRNAVLNIPEAFYSEADIGTWLTHCLYACHGDILSIPEVMTICYTDTASADDFLSNKNLRPSLSASIHSFNRLTKYVFYAELYDTLVNLNRASLETENQIADLVIFDDVFPHPVSGFRLEEFSAYLNHFQNIRILSNGLSASTLGEEKHSNIIGQFLAEYPCFQNRVLEDINTCYMQYNNRIHSKLAYCCFLSGIYNYIDVIERNQIPFVFELYPGGRFLLDSRETDQMLFRVLRSPYFRKVIVTQSITKDYLIRKQLCKPEQIKEIFGVVTSAALLQTRPIIRKSNTLRVCFAAMRYTPDGHDKGYDVFLEMAQILLHTDADIEFHVAGAFDKNVLPLGELEGKVTFHGILRNQDLSNFFKCMDIIVSPNINNAISKGAFDGFPTASCIEAGLNGVLIICTDPLSLNHGYFTNGENIEIVPHDAPKIARRVLFYYNNRDLLTEMIKKQYEKIQELYNSTAQIGKRIAILESEIATYESNIAQAVNIYDDYSLLRCRLLFSDKQVSFNPDYGIDFTLKVDTHGHASGNVYIGSIPENTYFWLAFVSDSAFLLLDCTLTCGQLSCSPVESLTQAEEGICIFDSSSTVFFGNLKNQYLKEMCLRCEADITPIEENAVAEWQERILLYEKHFLKCVLFHSEQPDTFNPTDRISFKIKIDSDGHATGNVYLGNLPENSFFWLYILPESPMLLLSCSIICGQENHVPLDSCYPTGDGICILDDDSFVYFGNLCNNYLQEPNIYFNADTVLIEDNAIPEWQNRSAIFKQATEVTAPV